MRPREVKAPAWVRSGRARVQTQAVNPNPRQQGPAGTSEWLVECQCPGLGRFWVTRLCQEQQRANRAMVSGPIQTRRMKCPDVFVCKLSSSEGGELREW